jgi:hypothetical protein
MRPHNHHYKERNQRFQQLVVKMIFLRKLQLFKRSRVLLLMEMMKKRNKRKRK